MTACGGSGTKAVSARGVGGAGDGGRSRPHERPAGRIKDSPLQHLGPPETHLPLRGMNIAIDEFEIHVDVKHTGRVLTALNNPKVSFAKRLLDRQTVNRTPVENHELEETIAPSLPGAREKSPKTHSFSGKMHQSREA